ncbi:MAG: tRNA uridine-5-carboxymethylaminomethyl(34) synthesis GTPase MnmE [Proteobacteria bacterium]|nr:tRNA uridine-5-carboxymethylaminomethyl(34) synthesis GTPase MnmE [Pseudomonadota bacterium]
MRFDDTIFALASAPGKSAVAIVRLSGGAARETVCRLTGGEPPAPRQAELRRLADPHNHTEIDRALVLWFPGPASYTGEDVAEFHVHGGRAVIAALLSALSAMKELRPAEAGEFSRRAFEHGKLDLTAAEGIADLVDAETEIQRRQALRQSGGALGELYEDWRRRLLRIRALIESTIDFSDQELPDGVLDPVAPEIHAISTEISAHLRDGGRGERLREGVQVAILGPVNAGKSSLLNRLAGRDAAIVAAEEGTTRDVIEVRMDLDGWPLTVADTAGLRVATSDVEAEGMRRAHARAGEADLKIVLLDGAHWPNSDEEVEALVDNEALAVLNKCDLLAESAPAARFGGKPLLKVSCKTGEGLDELLERIKDFLEARYLPSDSPVLTRSRHRHALEKCLESLHRYDIDAGEELAAEELRLAADCLGRITGRSDIEQVLDIIFKEFCIGK